jgi:hypothetical protein
MFGGSRRLHLRRLPDGAHTAFGMKKTLHEGMIHGHDFGEVAVRNDTLIGQHGDVTCQCRKGIEIMGDENDSESQFGAQGTDQPDEAVRTIRVESGSGLVE